MMAIANLLIIILVSFISLVYAEASNSNLVTENVEVLSKSSADKLNKYLNIPNIKNVQWSGVDNLYFLANFTDSYQLYQSTSAGADIRKITLFNDPIHSFITSPNADGTVVFAKDINGNEQFQLYSYDHKRQKTTRLSDGQSKNNCPVFSRDGKYLVWQSVFKKNSAILLTEIINPNNKITLLSSGDGSHWCPKDWSVDGKKLLLTHVVANDESELYSLDIDSKKITNISQSSQKILYRDTKFAVNRQKIFFISDQNSDFMQLIENDIASGKNSIITKGVDHDVEFFALSPNGKYLLFVVNEQGKSSLFLRDLEKNINNQIKGLPDQAVIKNIQFNHDNRRVVMTLNSATLPSDIWLYDLELAKFHKLKNNNIEDIEGNVFVNPSLITYPSFERQIPALIYKPKSKGPHPVLILIHGGPGGQTRPEFSEILQYWLSELNIAIIMPNIRGSSGYGQNYLNLDNGIKRKDAIGDIAALIDWIETQSDLDKDNIGVMGASYGGYMTLVTLVNYSNKIKAGVDIVGMSNLVTFLETTAEYRRDLRRTEYGDERDSKIRRFLQDISPLNNVKKISKPLFIIQGLNDPRVVVTEAQQMKNSLKDANIDAWYMVAKDEGHGFHKKPNRLLMYNAITAFWKKYLNILSASRD